MLRLGSSSGMIPLLGGGGPVFIPRARPELKSVKMHLLSLYGMDTIITMILHSFLLIDCFYLIEFYRVTS